MNEKPEQPTTEPFSESIFTKQITLATIDQTKFSLVEQALTSKP